jgi:hypothetical protein
VLTPVVVVSPSAAEDDNNKKMSRDQVLALCEQVMPHPVHRVGLFVFLVVRMAESVKAVIKLATELGRFLTMLSTLTILTAIASGKHAPTSTQ